MPERHPPEACPSGNLVGGSTVARRHGSVAVEGLQLANANSVEKMFQAGGDDADAYLLDDHRQIAKKRI